MKKSLSILLTAACVAAARNAVAEGEIAINRAAFRDKVYACFLGKNIGGTLGMPVEGNREVHNFAFYTPVPREPAANDDLDLQMLWLKVVQERGPGLTCLDLGEYWLRYVPVDWNEYGVGKRNMRDGFLPPVSGQFRNEQWRNSNGAWIRSEIWACLAPGNPALAARYAWEDACVDHGGAEGTYAEMFTAAIESAAFVEPDRDRLIAIGLSYTPPDSRVASAIHAALDARKNGFDLQQAREAVVRATESTGWFQAPRNVAFTILGWLYGDGDFGKSLCAAVNCGDDTDCTGATLGSILGILRGSSGIPAEWKQPVGEQVKTVAIAGFPAPKTLDELTDATVAAMPAVLRHHGIALREAGPESPAVEARGIPLVQAAVAEALWKRSPFQVRFPGREVTVTLDYGGEPVLVPGEARDIRLRLRNCTEKPLALTLEWCAPEGGRIEPASARIALPAGNATVDCTAALTADDLETAVARGSVAIRNADGTLLTTIPWAFAASHAVHSRDVALAARGARATSDSELDREPGCTVKAIDGQFGGQGDCAGQRWHSALTPHPHWIAVELDQPRAIAQLLVHFADPNGHPVDFDGQASQDGKVWTPLFSERGWNKSESYTKNLGVTLRHFRLTILRSASTKWPDAAQVSEIELQEAKPR
jgi:ADP-ribosylglycohydrolase